MATIAYSIDEVCDLLEVFPVHVHNWLEEGLLQPIIWNDRTWVQAESLSKFLSEKLEVIRAAQANANDLAKETVRLARV